MLDLMRWTARYAVDTDPGVIVHGSEDDHCQAITEARTRDASFEHTRRLIAGSPRATARGGEHLPSWAKAEDPTDMALRGIAVAATIVVHAGQASAPAGQRNRFDHVHLSIADTDDSYGMTHTYSDRSALMRVSNSLISACAQLHAVNWWRLRSAPGRHRAGRPWPQFNQELSTNFTDDLYPALGALRFYVLHQRLFGMASKIALRTTSSSLLDGQVFAAMFIFAHELGHHAQGHSADRSDLHGSELEADAYAFELMRGLFRGWRAAEKAQAVGAIALLALELDERTQFIRSPITHPSLATRWQHLQSLWPSRPRATPLAAADLTDATQVATAKGLPLPPVVWEALDASPSWDSSWHAPDYFAMVRGFDRAAGASIEQVEETLGSEGFAQAGAQTLILGLRRLGEQGPGAALQEWGVRRPDRILDPARPLAYFDLIEAIRRATAWDTPLAKEDVLRRAAATLCAEQLLPHLSPTIQNSEHQ